MENELAPEENPPEKLEQKPVGEKTKEESAKIKRGKKEENRGRQSFNLENLNNAPEGELAVDIYQTEDELVIRSAIAGIGPEKLDVLIENDVITIQGNREEPQEPGKADFLCKECYFGPFARKIISPFEIDPSRAKATMKQGIFTVRIPKIQKEKRVKVEIAKE